MFVKKCPECGSTAQVSVENIHLSQQHNTLDVTHSCGCGHRWVDVYEHISEITIKK